MNPFQIIILILSLKGDINAVIHNPTPHAVIRLAADVAGYMPMPHAQVVAFVLGFMAAGEPSTNPMRDGQMQFKRGGRRW